MFQQLVTEYAEAAVAYESDAIQNLAVGIGNRQDGLRDSLLRELILQNLNGFYFLPSIAPDGPNSGFVILLREVRHIPRELAVKIADGITAEEYKVVCEERPLCADRLSFAKELFAMPVGLLRSPHMEHLMQVFSILFSRIGLPDTDEAFIERAWKMLPSVGAAT